jgi:pilus assembly protein Flp/PilA
MWRERRDLVGWRLRKGGERVRSRIASAWDTARGKALELAVAVKRPWLGEEGQGLAEYALIIALIAIAVIGLLSGLGSKIGQVFQNITSQL